MSHGVCVNSASAPVYLPAHIALFVLEGKLRGHSVWIGSMVGAIQIIAQINNSRLLEEVI